ncbi:hypothetical protein FRC11_011948, partial [Ceratobasidium sp. 423]
MATPTPLHTGDLLPASTHPRSFHRQCRQPSPGTVNASASSPFAPAVSSMPGGVLDPEQVKLWKSVDDQWRRGHYSGDPATRVDAPGPGPHSATRPHSPATEGFAVDNATRVPQVPPSLAPATPSAPGGVLDPEQAKQWKAISDRYGTGPLFAPVIPPALDGVHDFNQAKLWEVIGAQDGRGPNAGGNTTQ